MRSFQRGSCRVLMAPLVSAIAVLCVVGPQVTSAQESLESTARSMTEFWARADTDAMVRLFDDAGVHVALVDKDHGTLDRRNAAVAVERFLDQYPVRNARLARAPEVGGHPDRGFAEIRWEAVAPGTSETVRYTLFVGLAQRGTDWRVVELRVLP